MSYKQRTGQAGFSNDSNGYKVDHRSETERRSESKETKKLQDGHEIHKQETKVVNLEELKSRETSRIATAEDVRALLEAEFEGIREIQTSREISVEEFNLIESQFRKKLGSKVDCQTEFKEEHKLENVLESPQWKTQFGMPVFTKNEIVDVREATIIEKNYPDPQLSKVSSGNVSLHKPSQPGAESGIRTTVTTDYPEGSLRHEAKQKRHVIEEVFIEDSDKFYEKTSAKKSKRDDLDYVGDTGATVQVRGLASSRDDDVTLREHNRHLMEVDAPTATPRKKRTTQSELVVEDTNLFIDETQRHSMFNQDYKIKPMYPEKSKALTSQDVDVYFVKEQSKVGNDKGNTSHVTSRTGPQQEIVVGEIGTFREGTLDTEKNRSVEKIYQDASAGKSKGFKKRLNQKDIKLLPKLRQRQEEIVINDPTVYDETQFLSLRKAQKKKRLFENTKTLPAKFGKKSKTQMDREVDLILKKSEEVAEGKHVSPLSDVPEQVVLDEPDVFREATSVKKKQNVSHSSLEKQQKQLEKMEREIEARALENSESGKQKGPQEELIIDDPEVFRETTLKRKKQEKAPPSKIMKDIMQDIDVLTQEARKSGTEEKYLKMDELDSAKYVEQSKPHQRELVLEDSTVYKENTLKKFKPAEVTSESKVVDGTNVTTHSTDKHQGEVIVDQDKTVTEVIHKKQNAEADTGLTTADLKAGKAIKSESIHHAQPELVVDDRLLFSDHNKPKDIHLEHGKAIQMAEIDDFDIPELDKPVEKQISEAKPEKADKKSSKPKKFLFKKKKKSQGESVVDESFVYEDAAKIRVPEVSKKGESEAKVSGPLSGKTFWNWNFGQHKAQQEVIKDESHYHEDKPEDDGKKQPEVVTEHTKEIEEGASKQVTTIQPPINFQDSDVDVEIKETPADLKIIQESSHREVLELQETKPDQMKLDVSTVVISRPDVVKVDETQNTLTVEEENRQLHEAEKEETEVKEATKEKHKFKINLPSFPKPHFGHKKQQESATDEKVTVVESVDAKIKVEPLRVVEEKTSSEVRIGSDVDSGIPQKEVVREQETIAVEETQKSLEVSQPTDQSEKIDQGEEINDAKQSKPVPHKSKFHFPSFTIPKPHINFGFKKHQPEAVEAAETVVAEESKVDETTTKEYEKKAEGKDLTLRENTIIQEDVFVEETHDITKEIGAAKEQSQLEGEKSMDPKDKTLPESLHAEDSKKDDDKSHDHKFKINLPHIPKPHLNIHFKKDKDAEQKSEIDQEKEPEEEVKEDVKTDKFKFTVPHINLHVPHIHFASTHKQDEVVVDDKEVISDSSRLLIAEGNPKDKLDTFTIETDVSVDSQPFETPEKTESRIIESGEVKEKLPKQEVLETDAIQVSEEKVETSKKEPVKEGGTLEEKGKKKMKFNFPHFSLPRSHGKQTEAVANEALVVEDSTKLKLSEKKVDDVSGEHSDETSVDKDDVDKEKKSDNKFKIRLPKPHFKFGFKSKEKQKPQEIEKEVTNESFPVGSDSKALKPDVSEKELKIQQEEQQKEVPPAFLTQPASEEFTETVKYVLDAGEDLPSGPMTIKVDPEEYKVLINKHKLGPKNVVDSKPSEEIFELNKEAGVQLPQVIEQVAVCVPYYEYEPSGNEGEADVLPESKPLTSSKTDTGVTLDANVPEQPKTDEGQTSKPSEEVLEPEIASQEKQEKDVLPKSKSKFHFPCIKMKKPFLKKCEDAEPGSEDDPAYGEVSTEELKEDAKQLEGKPVYENVESDKSDKTSKKKHQVFKSLGKKSVQEEIVVNDAHIYTDNSTLGRRLLNKLRHKDKVAPGSAPLIVENDLPESAENRQKGDQEADEQAVVSSKQATLETETSTLEKHQPESSTHPDQQEDSKDQQVLITTQDVSQVEAKTSHSDDGGREVDSSTLESSKSIEKGLKHKKQDELIVGGGSIITEPQTSPIHKALHKLGKSNEQINAQSNQEMHEPEKVIKRKEHGKLTSLFHRSSGEYDLDHQKRTNQPLVELISSRSKPAEESDAPVSAQEESSWSINYRKNLTLDATNHLTFESEYDPDQSVSVENVQLFCPTARRSYRKQVQIDDFDLLRTINETGSFKTSTPKKAEGSGISDATVSDLVEDSSIITPSKASTSATEPVKWTSSQAKNTSYFSTLPEFATVDDQQKSPHFVVVAIDFGTTFSGYAFSFKNDVDSIHIMRKWEGGDPGVVNQKTPTTLLLTPDKEFHSFGFTARDFYHDLSPKEAKKWLYFEKFKMALHYNADLSSATEIQAANGFSVKAQDVFAYALRFFKNHALQEISEQTGTDLIEDDIKWVITVPAIWKAPAKQFMREAAYKAGIASEGKPDQLLIALEPEAASIFVRKQRLRQLILEEIDELKDSRTTKSNQDLRPSSPVLIDTIAYQTQLDESASWSQSVASNALSMSFQRCPSPTSFPVSIGHEIDITDNRFMVADCGGGTVDITVYEMLSATGGKLKELYKASGGPFGSIGVDFEFEKLLVLVFGQDFIDTFKVKRPAGWVDLMMAFESRKRAANPFKTKPLNVSLPFSFIDYFKKFKNATVESAIRKYNNKDVKWSSQGMMRLMPECMNRLFQPTLDNITVAIANVLNQPDVSGVKHIFLVGGFAESPMLQQEIRKNFAHQARILIPTDVSLTILKGAVLYGIDPSIVVIRKSRLTYGLGVLNRFVGGKHPESKKAMKDGVPWCVDVFDHLVLADQSVALGSSVIRSYTPAGPSQKFSLFHIYCTENRDVEYVTDDGVVKCGTLRLDLDDYQWELETSPSRPVSQNLHDAEASPVVDGSKRREIQARLTFGDTEIKIIALDVATGNYVRATLDFLNK